MASRLKTFFTTYPKVIYEWFKALIYLIYGTFKILRVPEPRVTFFGGARHKLEDLYARSAFDIAKHLVENKIAILTGGGPGVMEMANCGATEAALKIKDKKIRSMGIGVKDLPGETGINQCAQDFLLLDYFFSRKWLLMRYSKAFVIFPGGFGTVDEFMELLTLIQTKKMKKFPIILFGIEFWKPFLEWIEKNLLKEELISPEDFGLIVMTDDKNEVCKIITKHCNDKLN